MKKTIDIHGLSTIEAKKIIEKTIVNSKEVKELEIIHGYNSGNNLRDLVRDRNIIRSRRIIRREFGLNQGVTSLILK